MKINGSLVFDASSASEIQNLRVQKLTGAELTTAGHNPGSDLGRAVYVTTAGGAYSANTLYVGGATTWVALATGGNAAALQTEVNNIETTLGAIVNDATGEFVEGAVTGPAIDAWTASHAATAPQDLTEILQAISDYATAGVALAGLNDVAIVAADAGDFLRYNGTKWADHVLVAADLTDVTSSAAELNILDGATLDVTELNFVDGVTSSIQTQLNNKQPLDAGLTSLSTLATAGFVTVDATGNVVSARSLVAPAAGITISNVNGSGDPVFALANDLLALEGLATNGYIVRTGDGSAITRALSTVAGDLVITGSTDGVSTDTTFGLATVNQAATGSFVKVTLDTKGRVTGNTAVTTGDITALVSGTYVDVAGDTMTGSLIMSAETTVTVPTPTGGFIANNAVNKSYVDSLVTGISWKEPVDSVGAANPGTAAIGYRFLNTTDGKIYTATTLNTFDAGIAPAANWSVLDKATDGGYTYDADTLTWVQFSGAGQINAGVGLAKNGNTLDVLLGAGIAQLPTDEVGVDIASGKAVQLTSTETGGQVTFVLDTGSGLQQSASGLKISAAGVTNAMLVNPQLTINGDAGTDALALGDTLQIKGVSAQGISTSVAESPAGTSTFTVTVADTTTSTKGVAQFSDADFAVAAGVVTVKDAGIDNVQLVNSTVTLTGTAGSDAFALGESVAIVGGGGGEVSTAVTANQVAISVRDATALVKGVASFAATDFLVTAGDVTVVAKGLDALTDVAVSGSAAGQTLVYSTAASAFVNRKVFHTEAVASSSTWNVAHGLGQKYCNVTVADASNEVVIPQSITFVDANNLTVTFNTAIAGFVMVSGVSGA